MKRFHLATTELHFDPEDPPEFRGGWASIHRAIGGEHLHGNLIELAPGLKSCPYHWEAASEEWLLVLSGAPHVRTPEGEQQLRPGDLVCFGVGAGSAHQLINRSEAAARMVIFSNVADPNVIVYPDSGKVGVRGDLDLPGSANYALDATIDYWEGE